MPSLHIETLVQAPALPPTPSPLFRSRSPPEEACSFPSYGPIDTAPRPTHHRACFVSSSCCYCYRSIDHCPRTQSTSATHTLHLLLRRWCRQMTPPHSSHLLHMRWCQQMLNSDEFRYSPSHTPYIDSSDDGAGRCWSRRILCICSSLSCWGWQMFPAPHSLH